MLSTIAILLGLFQIIIPRKYSLLPILIAAIHTTQSQAFPNLSILRVLLIIEFFKLLASGHIIFSFKNPIDRIIAFFCTAILLSSFAHSFDYGNPYTFRVRLIFDFLSFYLICKFHIQSESQFLYFCKTCAILIIPLTGLMLYESLSGGNNLYKYLGAPSTSLIRDGEIRSQGPFGTPILTGTAVAVTFPLLLILWNNSNRRLAAIAFGCSLVAIFLTHSSTPIGALLIGLIAISTWKYRHNLPKIIWCTIGLIAIAQLFRNRPVWYLIAITDFVGGSTGWHRAYLIDTALDHLNEWWLFGADYTRHWMPYGLPSVPQHCDLTNYYIHLGVIAGIGPIIFLGLTIFYGFKTIKRFYSTYITENNQKCFLIWVIGAMLFTHTATFLVISYYDHTYVFFVSTIAVISNFSGNLFRFNQP